jgi:hypothetical protein
MALRIHQALSILHTIVQQLSPHSHLKAPYTIVLAAFAHNTASTLTKLKQYQQARQLYTEAAQLDPNRFMGVAEQFNNSLLVASGSGEQQDTTYTLSETSTFRPTCYLSYLS